MLGVKKVIPFITIFLLSLIDGIATTYYISNDEAIEANYLMALLISHYGFVSFIIIKQCIVGSGLFILYWFRKSRPTIIKYSLLLILIIYSFIVFWHIIHYQG